MVCSCSGQEVVGVHGHVNQAVPHPAEGCVAAASKLGSEPGEGGQGGVVDDVERGEVGRLTSQQEEYRVEKVDELGDVEPPGEGECRGGVWVVGVVHRLTEPVVSPSKPEPSSACNISQGQVPHN